MREDKQELHDIMFKLPYYQQTPTVWNTDVWLSWHLCPFTDYTGTRKI